MVARSMRVLRGVVILASVLALTACAAPTPPGPAPVRAPTQVKAPFAKSWEAVVDLFAEQNVGIQTIDRASGLIVGQPSIVPRLPGRSTEKDPRVDCGADAYGNFRRADAVAYNVRVRGDSSASTVQFTMRFSYEDAARRRIDCSTRGIIEAELESKVKAMAEGR